MENRFQIKGDFQEGVSIKKDESQFSITRRIDEDLWFTSSSEIIDLPLNGYSRDSAERDSFKAFEYLMKLIIGRYYLSGDATDSYNGLPKGFIDIKNKTITWHSDTGRENILKIQLLGSNIHVSLYRDLRFANDSSRIDDGIRVRIRTSGSEYGYYYQEFENFYRELSHVASQYGQDIRQSTGEVPVQKQKTVQTP